MGEGARPHPASRAAAGCYAQAHPPQSRGRGSNPAQGPSGASPPSRRARDAGPRPPHPPVYPYLGPQPPFTRRRKANPSPHRGAQEIRPRSGEPHPQPAHPRAQRRPRPSLPGGRLRASLGSGPGRRPSRRRRRRRPGGGGLGAPQRGARRLRRGAGGRDRGRGEEGRRREGAAGRGRPHLRHCNARSRRVIISGGSGARGGPEEGASGAQRRGRGAASAASAAPGSRRPGGSPGTSCVGALSTPGTGTGNGRFWGPRRRAVSKEPEAAASRPPDPSGREAAARLRLRRLRLSPAPLRPGERAEGMWSGDGSRALGRLVWDRKEWGEATAAGPLTCVRSGWRRTDGAQQSGRRRRQRRG